MTQRSAAKSFLDGLDHLDVGTTGKEGGGSVRWLALEPKRALVPPLLED